MFHRFVFDFAAMSRVKDKLAAWKIPMTTDAETLCDLINEVQFQAHNPEVSMEDWNGGVPEVNLKCMEKHAGINAMGCEPSE